MKKINSFFISIFILCAVAIFCFTPSLLCSNAVETNVGSAKVISSVCDIYSQPDFSSEKLETKLKFGDVVEIVAFENDFAKIDINNEEGYIYKYYVTQNTEQDVYPVFNATIRNDTKIFDINEEPSDFTAKKGSRVYLYNGFDDKDKLTFVQIVLDDGSLYVGKIKTQDIKPDGVSGLLIAGISIIIAAVTIILSLVFIRKKRKKKQEN